MADTLQAKPPVPIFYLTVTIGPSGPVQAVNGQVSTPLTATNWDDNEENAVRQAEQMVRELFSRYARRQAEAREKT